MITRVSITSNKLVPLLDMAIAIPSVALYLYDSLTPDGQDSGGIVMHRSAGFTLLELLTALTVVLILLSVALPGFQQQRQAAQLSEAASRLYSDIQQTRVEARRLGSDALNIYFFGDKQWCYRITDRSDVDCSGCDALCDIAADGRVRGLSWHELPLVSLANVTYSGRELGFQRHRAGLSAGHVLFRSGTRQLMVRSSGYGRLRICSPDASGMAGVAPC